MEKKDAVLAAMIPCELIQFDYIGQDVVKKKTVPEHHLNRNPNS
jgi:hypothetical protein